MASAQFVNNRVYLFRLQILLIDGGNLVIKNIFNQKLQSQNISLTVCLNQEKPTITRLKAQKVITQAQYDLLFPSTGQAPSLADFHFFLTINLLRNLKICGLNPKYNWKSSPSPTDLSVEADITRLREYHHKVTRLSDTTGIRRMDFYYYWTEIEQILLRLNGSVPRPVPNLQQMIDDFKTCSLDPVAEQKFQNEIDVWREMVEAVKEEGQHLQTNKPGLSEDQSTQEPMPTFSHPHDGRLIILQTQQLNGLLSNSENAYKGGFGEVYISKDKVGGLEVRVVIKKIVCKGNDRIKMSSIYNEKVASRTMHFAIVPLIAYMDKTLHENKREFYFISPYLEGGNLFDIISKDKECKNSEDLLLGRCRRIQILFQIASALDHLHTPVLGSRGIILHMDVKSTNIVLDEKMNARLIDFGLAREMNEGQTHFTQTTCCGTPGYHPTSRYSKLTIYEDYHNFGVVIRELLTGRAPYIEYGDHVFELRSQGKWLLESYLQGSIIWQQEDEICQEAHNLINLSVKCIDRKKKEVTSKYLVEEVKKMCRRGQRSGVQGNKCDLCIVNDAVRPEHFSTHPKECNMKVCASCMRHSHVNPIKCHTCNEDVIPTIGYTYAAVLIAGNDLENKEFARSFTEEVKEIKDVLTSKIPCVIGIREENISMIVPSSPGIADDLLPQLHTAFTSLKTKKNLDTLIVYFSGHHSQKTGFTLGSSTNVLTVAAIQNNIRVISEGWGHTTRILVFLDCCKPPGLGPIPDLSDENVTFIQMNACKYDEDSVQPASGSKFQKFFIQAFTRRVFNTNCHNSGLYSSISTKEDEDECKDCKMDGDFISVEKLLKYISDHMNTCYKGKQPVMCSKNVTWGETCIGYNVDFTFELTITLELPPKSVRSVSLQRMVYCDINRLRKNILTELSDKHELYLTPVEFADALALRIQTGSQTGTELDSILKVSAAWNARREIIASYRTASSILKGRVVLFQPVKHISQYLANKELFNIQTKEQNMASLSRQECRDVIVEMSRKQELEEFRDILLQICETWTDKIEKQRELRVTFPCMNDVKWQEFLVLDLSVISDN